MAAAIPRLTFRHDLCGGKGISSQDPLSKNQDTSSQIPPQTHSLHFALSKIASCTSALYCSLKEHCFGIYRGKTKSSKVHGSSKKRKNLKKIRVQMIKQEEATSFGRPSAVFL
jgi:hypothetical protein